MQNSKNYRQRNIDKKKRQAANFQRVAVIVILSQVFLYTWIHLIFSFIVKTEIAPMVSCAFYAFCGAEAGLLAWLKSFDKKRKDDSKDENTNYSETDEP